MIGFEPLDDLLADGLEEMLFDHWQEVGLDHDTIPLAPDWDEYRALEKMGRHRTIAMREFGELVGYNAFFTNKSLNYRHTLFATNNVIWLKPEKRKGMAGVRLIKESERLLGLVGAVKIFYHIKVHILLGAKRSGTMGDLLLHLGYRHIEDSYSKVLGE
jgi:hypothetical protein